MVALPIHYRPSFRLPHALAVSLLLHVVLWIILSLGGWTPRTNLTVMEPPQKDDDSELTFTFADEVSEVEGRRQGLIPTEEVFDGDLPIPEPSLVPRSGAPSAPSEQQATTPTQQTAPSRQAPSESPSTETPPTPPQPKEQTEEIVGIEAVTEGRDWKRERLRTIPDGGQVFLADHVERMRIKHPAICGNAN